MLSNKITRVLLTAALALTGSCRQRPDAATSVVKEGPTITPVPHDRYIAKVAELLQGGDEPSASLIAKYSAQDTDAGREALVDELMADPRFADVMLRFNLFFLNRGANDVKTAVGTAPDGTVLYEYAKGARAMPAAIAAAATLFRPGARKDYMAQLLSMRPRLVVQPVVGDVAAMKAVVDTTIQGLDEALALPPEQVCSRIRTMGGGVGRAFGPDLGSFVRNRWHRAVSERVCQKQAAAPEEATAAVKTLQTGIRQLFDDNPGLYAAQAGVKDLTALYEVKVPTVAGLPNLSEAFTFDGMWGHLVNSSTNYNRRRAAYVFRTFLCEDLAPIDVAVDPAAHAGSGHASSPACQGCHYKLDPMAGLFRHRGLSGADYSQAPNHIFDDGKQLSTPEAKQAFLATWTKVGHHIGSGVPSQGWLAAEQRPDLDDLERLMYYLASESLQAKQCLARRMTEYLITTEQAYDGAWLKDLSGLVQSSAQSATLTRALVKRIVTSNAFRNETLDKNQCYDRPTTGDPNSTMPCEITLTVETHCTKCHNTDYQPDVRQTWVNFTRWVDLADGKKGFEHFKKGAGGEKVLLTQQESYDDIAKRLRSLDTKERMPPSDNMSADEKNHFLTWMGRNP